MVSTMENKNLQKEIVLKVLEAICHLVLFVAWGHTLPWWIVLALSWSFAQGVWWMAKRTREWIKRRRKG